MRHSKTQRFVQNSQYSALISGNKSVDTRESNSKYTFDENSDSYAKEIKEYNEFKDRENWKIICDNQQKGSEVTP